MSKNIAATADELVAELAGVTDWPKMARKFSEAIATIRVYEREREAMQCEITELRRRLTLDRQAPAA